MLNKLTEFVPNKMFNTIKLFFIKYWLRIEKKTQSDCRYYQTFALPYVTTNTINKHDECRKIVLNKQKKYWRSSEQNQLYTYRKNIYLICDTNSTLTNMCDESKMFWVFIFHSTFFSRWTEKHKTCIIST